MPDDVAGLDLVGLDEAERHELAGALLDELVVGRGPHVVALVHEVLETEAGPALLDQVRRPRTEVLDPADLHLGVVDVDPVVGEPVLLGDHERDGQEVAVAEVVGRGQHLGGNRRVHRLQQLGDRHRGDDVVARELLGRRPSTANARPSSWRTVRHRGLHVDRGALVLHDLGAALPHHPGAVLGVLELLDEAGDLLLVPVGQERVDHRLEQREVLDALGAPSRPGISSPGMPHTFSV